MPLFPRHARRSSLLLALCTSATLHAAEPDRPAELFQLANGMRWIAAPMDPAGEVTIVFYVASGTAHETPESRGATATLVELWRMEADALAARGALATAAYANPDFTVARATWPKENLAEALAVAATRWSSPEASRFEEARSRTIAARDRALQSRFRVYWELCRAAFNVHPYGEPYFGGEGDLERLAAPAFRAHVDTHLVPANVVAVLTGDFDMVELRALAEREFGRRPTVAPPRAVEAEEPPQRGERRVISGAPAISALALGFHKEAGASASMAAWDVLLEIWKSRLAQRTPLPHDLITRFDAGQAPAMKHPNLVFALWETKREADLDALEKVALAEIARLVTDPPSPEEIETAKLKLGAETKPDPRTHGQHLADWLVMTGDWRPAFEYAARVRAVTPEQVRSLAPDTFRVENRTVVVSKARAASAGADAVQAPVEGRR